jgi:hypothetical protein
MSPTDQICGQFSHDCGDCSHRRCRTIGAFKWRCRQFSIQRTTTMAARIRCGRRHRYESCRVRHFSSTPEQNRALLAVPADAWLSICCHNVSETDESYVFIRIAIALDRQRRPAVVPHAVLRRRTDGAPKFSSKRSRFRVPNSGTTRGFRARATRAGESPGC